jgi:hypothetical protein
MTNEEFDKVTSDMAKRILNIINRPKSSEISLTAILKAVYSVAETNAKIQGISTRLSIVRLAGMLSDIDDQMGGH